MGLAVNTRSKPGTVPRRLQPNGKGRRGVPRELQPGSCCRLHPALLLATCGRGAAILPLRRLQPSPRLPLPCFCPHPLPLGRLLPLSTEHPQLPSHRRPSRPHMPPLLPGLVCCSASLSFGLSSSCAYLVAPLPITASGATRCHHAPIPHLGSLHCRIRCLGLLLASDTQGHAHLQILLL